MFKVEQSLQMPPNKITAQAKPRISKSLRACILVVIEYSRVKRRCKNMQEPTQVNGPTSVTNAISPSLNFHRYKNTSVFMKKVNRTSAKNAGVLFPKLAIWFATDASTQETNPTNVRSATRSLALEVTWASICKSIKVKKCPTNAQYVKRHINIKQVWESIFRQFINKKW